MPTDVSPPGRTTAPGQPTAGQALPTAPTLDTEPDWTDQVTDLIVDVVDRVHDSTTGPLVRVAKGAVYVVLASIISIAVLILLTILTTRLLELIPGEIWIPYTVLGVLLCLLGFVLWSKRTPIAE